MLRPTVWVPRRDAAGPDVAVLLTACDDPGATARSLRTVLPRARLVLYGDGFTETARTAAESAGVEVRSVPPSSRDDLVRHMLAEVDADTYVLAHGVAAGDACVAALLAAEVDAGRDLVDVECFADEGPGDAGERLLGRVVDFAYGGHGNALRSDFKACSRRFAVSYRRTAPLRGGAPSARALTLHALALRLPVGQVRAFGPRRERAPPESRRLAGWAALLALVGRLLVEERPRRVFGALGFAVATAGIATALPDLRIHHGQAAMASGMRGLAALLVIASGMALGATGLLLDTLASARQEVRRLGAAAIPRRAGGGGAGQSSVS